MSEWFEREMNKTGLVFWAVCTASGFTLYALLWVSLALGIALDL
jgi:hypothetical protein